MPGWLGVALVVAGYDTWALRTGHATMSAVYKTALGSTPVARAAVLGTTAYLVAHLTGILPKDPLSWLARLIRSY